MFFTVINQIETTSVIKTLLDFFLCDCMLCIQLRIYARRNNY